MFVSSYKENNVHKTQHFEKWLFALWDMSRTIHPLVSCLKPRKTHLCAHEGSKEGLS